MREAAKVVNSLLNTIYKAQLLVTPWTRNTGSWLTAEATPANPKKGAYGGQVDMVVGRKVGFASTASGSFECQIRKLAGGTHDPRAAATAAA